MAEGTPSAEAAFLRERVKVGSLGAERVSLAAHAGHPAASLLYSHAEDQDLEAWANGFAAWPNAQARVALACGFLVLPFWERRPRPGINLHYNPASPLEQLNAAVACVICPCARHTTLLDLTFSRVARPNMIGVHGEVEWAVAHDAIELACSVVLHSNRVHEVVALTASAIRLAFPGERDGSGPVRDAIREALVPWALGTGDPLEKWHQVAEDRARLPLCEKQLHSFLAHLRERLFDSGVACDDTFSTTRSWAREQGLEPEGLVTAMREFGAACDCMVWQVLSLEKFGWSA